MQDSSPDPPFDSSSPALRHDSTPVAKMIKFQQEHKIDYTVNTEEGLGNLRKFPREIRDMIYGFSEPPVGLFKQGTKRHINQALRRLSKCPLLSTSKRLCVEFLESFVRAKTFVACSEKRSPVRQFMRFFISMSNRIDLTSHVRGLGLQRYSDCSSYSLRTSAHARLDYLELAAEDTKHLWNIHKNYNIPVSKLHLSISYPKPFGVMSFLYELDRGDWCKETHALLHAFDNTNIQTLLRDRSASLQCLHNSIAYQQDQLDAFLQLKLKNIHNRLPQNRALKADREAREYVAEFKKSEGVKSLVEIHTAIIDQTFDLWSALEEQDKTEDNVDSAESQTTMD